MSKYRNLQIQHKLIASFAAILAVVLVLAIANYIANSRTHSLSKSLRDNAYMAYKDGSSLMDDFTKLSDALTEAEGRGYCKAVHFDIESLENRRRERHTGTHRNRFTIPELFWNGTENRGGSNGPEGQ
jgi:hypothetical protein